MSGRIVRRDLPAPTVAVDVVSLDSVERAVLDGTDTVHVLGNVEDSLPPMEPSWHRISRVLWELHDHSGVPCGAVFRSELDGPWKAVVGYIGRPGHVGKHFGADALAPAKAWVRRVHARGQFGQSEEIPEDGHRVFYDRGREPSLF